MSKEVLDFAVEHDFFHRNSFLEVRLGEPDMLEYKPSEGMDRVMKSTELGYKDLETITAQAVVNKCKEDNIQIDGNEGELAEIIIWLKRWYRSNRW